MTITVSHADKGRIAVAIDRIRESAWAVPVTGDLDAIRRSISAVLDACHDAGVTLNEAEEAARAAALKALAERSAA